MEFRQIEAFAAVVRYRSFTLAAEALFLTQPTVSAHVAAIEQELGTTLLVRANKDIVLTSAGEIFYKYSEKLLSIRDEACAQVMNQLDNVKNIHIAGSSVPANYYLPSLMVAFRSEFPEYSFIADRGDSADVEALVLAGEIELGFMGSKPSSRKCASVPFAVDQLVVITPPSERYKLIKGRFPLAMLMTEPFVTRELGSGTRVEMEGFLRSCGQDPVSLNTAFETISTDGVKRIVSNGGGISLISKNAAADYVASGQLLAFEPEPKAPKRNLYVVKLRNRHLSRGANEFFEFVKNNTLFEH